MGSTEQGAQEPTESVGGVPRDGDPRNSPSSSITPQGTPEGLLGSHTMVFTFEHGCETSRKKDRVAQGVSGPSSSCVWNPRVFADDARGWQRPFERGLLFLVVRRLLIVASSLVVECGL